LTIDKKQTQNLALSQFICIFARENKTIQYLLTKTFRL